MISAICLFGSIKVIPSPALITPNLLVYVASLPRIFFFFFFFFLIALFIGGADGRVGKGAKTFFNRRKNNYYQWIS